MAAVVYDDEWAASGFPVPDELKGKPITGRNMEIWKTDTSKPDEKLMGSIRTFCTRLVGAINRYYAEGNAFGDNPRMSG